MPDLHRRHRSQVGGGARTQRLAAVQGAVNRLVGSVGGGGGRGFASRPERWVAGVRSQGERNIADISPQYPDVLMGNSYFGPQGPKCASLGGLDRSEEHTSELQSPMYL